MNAAVNIRQQGILALQAAGLSVSACGGMRQSGNVLLPAAVLSCEAGSPVLQGGEQSHSVVIRRESRQSARGHRAQDPQVSALDAVTQQLKFTYQFSPGQLFVFTPRNYLQSDLFQSHLQLSTRRKSCGRPTIVIVVGVIVRINGDHAILDQHLVDYVVPLVHAGNIHSVYADCQCLARYLR